DRDGGTGHRAARRPGARARRRPPGRGAPGAAPGPGARLRDGHAYPRPARLRRAGHRPGAADRRHPGADHLLRDHHHLRRAFDPAVAAAGGQRAAAGAAEDPQHPGQRRRPLFRRRAGGPAYRRGGGEAGHRRGRRRRPRAASDAARRRPHPVPGGGHRPGRAGPAGLPPHRHRHRTGAAVLSRTPRQPVWPIYRRLLGYTARYRVFLGAALLGMLVEAGAGATFIWLMEPLTNRGFVQPEPQMAVLLPLAIIGLFVLRSLATFVTDYGMARTGRSVVRDLREEVLSKYLRLPSSQFDTEATPVMVSRLNFDTEQVTQASSEALKTLITDSLTIVYLLGLMLYMSVKVTLAMLLITPLIGLIVWYVGKRYRRISGGIQDGMGRMAASA